MNDAKAVQAVLDDLSEPKLRAYRNLGLVNDWQVVQSYIFLLDLAGHFVVPLQLLEIALRNKMHSAISKQTRRPDWYLTVPHSPESQRLVRTAQSDALTAGKTSIDDIVCRLTFGFWVFMTHPDYRPSGAGTNLWQFIKSDVFPGGGATTINTIFHELKNMNALRNRLFHHEPLWKAAGQQSMGTAVARTKLQYDRVLKVLGWISPEKLALINGLGVTAKFYQQCNAANFQPTPIAVVAALLPSAAAGQASSSATPNQTI